MSRQIRIFVTIITLILLSMIFGIYSSFGFGFSLEYDKYMSNYSLITNSQTITNIGLSVNDMAFDSLRFKMFTAIPIVYIPKVIIHEKSHATAAEKAGLFIDYKWSERKCIYLESSNPETNLYINIQGLKIENEFKDRIFKDEIMNGGDYKSALSLLSLEGGFYGTAQRHDNESNDLNRYTNNLKKINPNTMITRSYVDNLIKQTVVYDPSMIFNTLFIAHTFWTNVKWSYKFPHIHPNFDFNLYPNAITKEIGLSKNIGEKHFLNVTYEWGRNVWNDKIEGLGFEFTNIPIYHDFISFDIKCHLVEKTMSYQLTTLHVGNSYIRWKHNDIKVCELEDENEFYFGYIFNF